MCNPAAAQIGISVAQEALSFRSLQDSAERTEENITANALAAYESTQRRELQERAKTTASVAQTRRQAQQALGLSRAGAAEAGVAGGSVDALMRDFEAQELTQLGAQRQNQEFIQQQLTEEREGVQRRADAQLQSIPQPNLLNSLLRIGGAAVGTLGKGPDTTLSPQTTPGFITGVQTT